MEHIIEVDDEVLNKFGDDVIAEMISILKRAGKVNSGRLINSFRHEFTEQGNDLVMNIFAEDYAYNIDKGRRPGNYAPIDQIKKWCRSKGIKESLAYPINRKIFKLGIRPTPFIREGFKKAFEKDKTLIVSKIKKNIITILKEEE